MMDSPSQGAPKLFISSVKKPFCIFEENRSEGYATTPLKSRSHHHFTNHTASPQLTLPYYTSCEVAVQVKSPARQFRLPAETIHTAQLTLLRIHTSYYRTESFIPPLEKALRPYFLGHRNNE